MIFLKLTWLSCLFIFSSASANQKNNLNLPDTIKIVPQKIVEGDTVRYKFSISDPGYESFLLKQPAKEFYAESFYKAWNNWYVVEWNNRNRAKNTLFQTYIVYNSNEEYGLEVEYRLYNFFLYFEKKNNIRLLPRS